MEDLNKRLESLVQQASERADALPYVRPLRLFWDDLHATRDWWPILIPALILIGWRTYVSERQQLHETLRRERELAASAPPPPPPSTTLTVPGTLAERGYTVSAIVHRKPPPTPPPSSRWPPWQRS